MLIVKRKRTNYVEIGVERLTDICIRLEKRLVHLSGSMTDEEHKARYVWEKERTGVFVRLTLLKRTLLVRLVNFV